MPRGIPGDPLIETMYDWILHGPALQEGASTSLDFRRRPGDQHHGHSATSMSRTNEQINDVSTFHTPMKIVARDPGNESDNLSLWSFGNEYVNGIAKQILL